MQYVEANEIVVIIPNFVVGDGESGDPLSTEVKNLIYTLAEVKYWPYDFGEGDDYGTELWFFKSNSVEIARKQAEHFINSGGY